MDMLTIAQIKLSALLEHIEDAYAPNTIRAYRADMLEFIGYCEKTRQEALPAEPLSVADFLLQSSNSGVKASTIKRKESSISAIHRLSYLTDPTKHPEVQIAMRKINRRLGTRFNQAYPINQETLHMMLACCGDDLRGKRDRMLLLLAYETMRRRSELVSLRVEDWTTSNNGSSKIFLRQSKTDQTGMGAVIYLDQSSTLAIKDWIEAAGLQIGHLVRGVAAGGRLTERLNSGQVGRIYKKLARECGLPDEVKRRISGHSARVGGAQDLLACGASIAQIMAKVGWTKVDTVMRYVGLTPIQAINSAGIANITTIATRGSSL
jgi:site-specific recombinase XerD